MTTNINDAAHSDGNVGKYWEVSADWFGPLVCALRNAAVAGRERLPVVTLSKLPTGRYRVDFADNAQVVALLKSTVPAAMRRWRVDDAKKEGNRR